LKLKNKKPKTSQWVGLGTYHAWHIKNKACVTVYFFIYEEWKLHLVLTCIKLPTVANDSLLDWLVSVHLQWLKNQGLNKITYIIYFKKINLKETRLKLKEKQKQTPK
jgi:hypothetical protein